MARLTIVDSELGRITGARLALTGAIDDPEVPLGSSESAASRRRRKLISKQRAERILAWAQTRDDWWTIRELADALGNSSVNALSPTVGKMTERGELRRDDG